MLRSLQLESENALAVCSVRWPARMKTKGSSIHQSLELRYLLSMKRAFCSVYMQRNVPRHGVCTRVR